MSAGTGRAVSAVMTNPNPSRTASCLSPVVIGDSPALARALEVLTRAAPTDVPVLILGETGTGKDLLPQAIHAAAPTPIQA